MQIFQKEGVCIFHYSLEWFYCEKRLKIHNLEKKIILNIYQYFQYFKKGSEIKII